jgi:hypothetical protein
MALQISAESAQTGKNLFKEFQQGSPSAKWMEAEGGSKHASGRCAAKTVLVRRPVRPPAIRRQNLWYVRLLFNHSFNDCWLRVYGRSGAADPLRLQREGITK